MSFKKALGFLCRQIPPPQTLHPKVNMQLSKPPKEMVSRHPSSKALGAYRLCLCH